MTKRNSFAQYCHDMFNTRMNPYKPAPTKEEALSRSKDCEDQGDIINALCVLYGWGDFIGNTELYKGIVSEAKMRLSPDEVTRLYTPYRHKKYYIGFLKYDVVLSLLHSIVYYGNPYTDKYIVTHGDRVPVTKAMHRFVNALIEVIAEKDNTLTRKKGTSPRVQKYNEFFIDNKEGLVQSCYRNDGQMRFNIGVQLKSTTYRSGVYDYEAKKVIFDARSGKEKEAEEQVAAFIEKHIDILLILLEKLCEVEN